MVKRGLTPLSLLALFVYGRLPGPAGMVHGEEWPGRPPRCLPVPPDRAFGVWRSSVYGYMVWLILGLTVACTATVPPPIARMAAAVAGGRRST